MLAITNVANIAVTQFKQLVQFLPATLLVLGCCLIHVSDSCQGQEVESARKLTLPSKDAYKAAGRLLHDIYGKDIRDAKTAEDKLELAGRLLEIAKDVKDGAQLYALFVESRELATSAATAESFDPAVKAAYVAIDRTADKFDYDVMAAQASVLWNIAQAESAASVRTRLIERALQLKDNAVSAERWDMAEKIAGFAVTVAKDLRHRELLAQTTEAAEQVAGLQQLAKQAEQAEATLESDPTDPEANLALGKYRCFIQSRWEDGMPLLALGADETLSAIAKGELQSPTSAGGRAALGDLWWDLADKESSDFKLAFQSRARYWYRLALPDLVGLTQIAVAKRLKEIDGSSAGSAAEDLPQPAARFPIGQWSPLLPLVDLEKHVVYGNWKMSRKGLAVQAAYCPRVMIPVAVAGSYDLETQLQLVNDKDGGGLTILLPVGESACAIRIDGDHGGQRRTYISEINKLHFGKNPAAIEGVQLANGRRHTVLASVRLEPDDRATISLDLDGQRLFQWQGDSATLSQAKFFQVPDQRCLGIGVKNSHCLFENVRLRLTSGSAELLEFEERIPHVVAQWKHGVFRPSGPMSLWSTGKINDPNSKNKWTLEGDRLVLNWGRFTDRVTISADGNRYSGKNNIGTPIRGRRLD